MMNNSNFQDIVERKYNEKFLEYNIRLDGRLYDEFRHIRVIKGPLKNRCIGSSLVSANGTCFLCGITAQVGPTLVAESDSSYISVNVEFPKACGIHNDIISTVSVETTYFITQILNNQDFFSKKKLCIPNSETVWYLYIHVVCLKFDGNPLDWTLVSVISSLEDTLLPMIPQSDKYNSWETLRNSYCDVSNTNFDMTDFRKLEFDGIPYSLTISKIFNTHWVVDPTYEESHEETITVWKMNNKNELYFLHKGSTHTEFKETASQLNTMLREGFLKMDNIVNEAKRNNNQDNIHNLMVDVHEVNSGL